MQTVTELPQRLDRLFGTRYDDRIEAKKKSG